MRRLAFPFLAAATTVVVLSLPGSAGAAYASETCLDNDPIVVAGHQVLPATEYCVPVGP
jgi:hypothetical protein